MSQLHHVRSRLLAAMGLAPAVVSLGLTGCDIEGEGPQSTDLRPSGTEEDHKDEGADFGELSASDIDSPLLELVLIGQVRRNHVMGLEVHNAVPGETLEFYINGVKIGAGVAGAEGSFATRIQAPDRLLWGEFVFHVVGSERRAHRSTAPQTLTVDPRLRDYPTLLELAPDTDTASLQPGDRFLVCAPRELAECEDIANFNNWKALDLTRFALGDSLPPELSVSACVVETTFDTTDCCYGVETWDAVDGSEDDACIEQVGNIGGGWGGGDGGGGGWGGDWWGGRPFTAAGERQRAQARSGDGWSTGVSFELPEQAIRQRVLDAWISAAQEEHSAVASFSRFNLELMALGAPADLVRRSTQAVVDEIEHAELCFAVASFLAGEPIEAGPIEIGGSLDRSVDPGMVLVAAIIEGCVNETVSAVQVREAARGVADEGLAKALAQVAIEEERHAELNWAFVRWLLDQHPELREVAQLTFASVVLPPEPAADPDSDALAAFGVLCERRQHRMAAMAIERVVRPCAAALLS